jgi:hypothetical protein
MDLFLALGGRGYQLHQGSVTGPPVPWPCVIAAYPRCGHLADTIALGLPMDGQCIRTTLPKMLEAINEAILGCKEPDKPPSPPAAL